MDVIWGEILGASRYRLYRRLKGDLGCREVFSGLAFEFRDTEPDAGRVYEYVAAENGTGIGPESTPIDTDATGWRFLGTAGPRRRAAARLPTPARL